MLYALGLALLFMLCPLSGGTEAGCGLWNFHPENDTVCCRACKIGNYLVKECGPDPAKLCAPCGPRTYANKSGTSCIPCKMCTGLQVEKSRCTSSSDTVCGCSSGFHCGDSECSHCIPCGDGQELSRDGKCHKCLYGTFKNASLSRCIPWTNSCPQEGVWILVNGTEVSDSVCVSCSGEGRKCANGSGDMMTMVIVAFISFFLGLLLSILNFCNMHTCKQTKKRPGSANAQAAQMCRFGKPQQEQGNNSAEQGGSTGSISSNDSEKSLLSV